MTKQHRRFKKNANETVIVKFTEFKGKRPSTRLRRNGNRNCRESREKVNPSERMVKLPENPSLTMGREAISQNRMLTTCKCCKLCEREFRALTQKGEFCSSRCRLLFWAAGEIVKEFRTGRANGLKNLIQELKDESE